MCSVHSGSPLNLHGENCRCATAVDGTRSVSLALYYPTRRGVRGGARVHHREYLYTVDITRRVEVWQQKGTLHGSTNHRKDFRHGDN